MSQQQINRNGDLLQLQKEGYAVEIVNGFLLVRDVPYVTASRAVARGILISKLEMSGDLTNRPNDHVALFAGEHPCDRHGRKLEQIAHSANNQVIADGVTANFSFSSKPKGGYTDYFHKMQTYAEQIAGHAKAIDKNATARTYPVISPDSNESPFAYEDTASSRAEITVINKQLRLDKVAIVGLGGTGSYVLDLIAKTPVWEIHLFDGDTFYQHNSFRSPGAASTAQLNERPKKVDYLFKQYSAIHRHIVPHDFFLDKYKVEELDTMNFVFLCIDDGLAKMPIVAKLEERDIPFIDVGMGIEKQDDKLLGVLRVTTSTPDVRTHVHDKSRIGFTGQGDGDVYSSNIQVAELNALNASLAVVKWKKLMGFYLDLENEHYCTFTVDGNIIINEDT